MICFVFVGVYAGQLYLRFGTSMTWAGFSQKQNENRIKLKNFVAV